MKFYIICSVLVMALVCGAYWTGAKNARTNCRAETEFAQRAIQTKMIKKSVAINAETVNTAVRDIRRVLREKYTIAE